MKTTHLLRRRDHVLRDAIAVGPVLLLDLDEVDQDILRPDARLRRQPVGDGLVERFPLLDPDDRRNRLITLTAKGRAKLAETDALWAKVQRGFKIAYGRAESKALREALRFLVSDNFVSTFESSLSSPAR